MAITPGRSKSGPSAQREDLAEQSRDGGLMGGAEPCDRGVIGLLVRRDHPESYLLNQAPLDPTAGPLTDAVRVDQQREHDLGIVGGATATVGPIADTEVREIELGDHVQNEPRQVVVR